jgi:Domain of unknown function (DUF4410)
MAKKETMKNGHRIDAVGLGGLALVIGLFGCTDVRLVREYSGQLPRPEQVVVHDLAVSADEVTLDKSPTTVFARNAKAGTRTEAELRTGRAVAKATSKELVSKLQAMGMPAVLASEARAGTKNVLEIKGQFVSIDEGNRFERVTIGLGAGRSAVSAVVQLYAEKDGQRILAEEFDADSKSLLTPGMAETMGAGAVAGHLGASAVVSGSTQILSEAFTQNAKADGSRMASAVAKEMEAFFQRQNWISNR